MSRRRISLWSSKRKPSRVNEASDLGKLPGQRPQRDLILKRSLACLQFRGLSTLLRLFPRMIWMNQELVVLVQIVSLIQAIGMLRVSLLQQLPNLSSKWNLKKEKIQRAIVIIRGVLITNHVAMILKDKDREAERVTLLPCIIWFQQNQGSWPRRSICSTRFQKTN